MPIPLLAAGLSVAASLAPGIISSLLGAKTEAEARRAVAPQRDAMLQRLMSNGMGRVEAERAAEEALSGEVAKAKEEGALPGWAEGLLSVVGGIGGWAAGAKLAAKGAAKALGKAAKEVAGDAASKSVPKLTGGKGPNFPGDGPIPMKGQPKTAEFEARNTTKNTPRTELGDTTVVRPLDIDQNLPETMAGDDLATAMLEAFPHPNNATTQVITPQLARTQRINPRLAQTNVMDPDMTQLMAPFPR